MDVISEAVIVVVLAAAVFAPLFWLYRYRHQRATKWILLGVVSLPSVLLSIAYFIGIPVMLFVFIAAAVAARFGAPSYLVPAIPAAALLALVGVVTASLARGDAESDDWFLAVAFALSSEAAFLWLSKLGRIAGGRTESSEPQGNAAHGWILTR